MNTMSQSFAGVSPLVSRGSDPVVRDAEGGLPHSVPYQSCTGPEDSLIFITLPNSRSDLDLPTRDQYNAAAGRRISPALLVVLTLAPTFGEGYVPQLSSASVRHTWPWA